MSKKNETITLISTFEMLFACSKEQCYCYWYGKRIEAVLIIKFSAEEIQTAIKGDKLLKIVKL